MASDQGQRRKRKTQARKGKLKREPIWYQRPPKGSAAILDRRRHTRLPEGVRADYDEKGGFKMGSSLRGKSACSRMGVDHWMLPNPGPDGGHNCVNPGCMANC